MSAQPNDLVRFKEDLNRYLSALEKTRKQYLDALAKKQTMDRLKEKQQAAATPVYINSNDSINDSTAVWEDVAVLDYYSKRYRQLQSIITLLDDPSKQTIWPALTKFLRQNTYQAILREQSIQTILNNKHVDINTKLEKLREQFASADIQSQFKKIQDQQSRDIALITLTMVVSVAGIFTGALLLHHLAAVIFAMTTVITLFVLIGVSAPSLTFKRLVKQNVKNLADAFAEDNNVNSLFSLTNKTHSYEIDTETKTTITAPKTVGSKEFIKTDLSARFLTKANVSFFEGVISADNRLQRNVAHENTLDNSIKKDVENAYTTLQNSM